MRQMQVSQAISFFVGAKALTLWVDGAESTPFGLTIDHDLWIGNWWILHIFLGIAALITGFLITGIPQNLYGSAEKQAKRKIETQSGQEFQNFAPGGGISELIQAYR